MRSKQVESQQEIQVVPDPRDISEAWFLDPEMGSSAEADVVRAKGRCHMPVKKIFKSYRNITGFIVTENGNSVHYQFSLERDLVVTVDFLSHSIVDRFEEQSCKIKYRYGNGPLRPYTPDLCVWFKGGGGRLFAAVLPKSHG